MRISILLLLPLCLSAATLETLIEHAKSNHTSLQAIEQKLSAVDNEYEVSRNFANPELSLSVSDIQLKEPINRQIEPMQYSALNIKQTLPYFGKRDANSNRVSAKKQKISSTLEEAKVKLIEAIKNAAYTIWQVEEEIKITNEYIKLTNQNIDLYTSYSSRDTKSHMGIMSAELSLSQLKIKKSKFESLRDGLYKKISYLSAMDVSSVEFSMKVEEPKNIAYYLDATNENRSYKVKKAVTEEANADIKVKELASFVDPSVQVGYYRRENFEDYLSVGVAFSLPIYGTEKSQLEASKKLSLSSQSETSDFKNFLNAEVENAYAQLQYSYKTYSIIHNDSLPQLTHMFDLTSSSIENGSDLFVYIELLQKKLALEEQGIEAAASYHKTLASLEAMIGEIQ
ncbi:MAG: TolC family protein [Sulfurimonas sp.]|jgi:outer membrane protein TolC